MYLTEQIREINQKQAYRAQKYNTYITGNS